MVTSAPHSHPSFDGITLHHHVQDAVDDTETHEKSKVLAWRVILSALCVGVVMLVFAVTTVTPNGYADGELLSGYFVEVKRRDGTETDQQAVNQSVMDKLLRELQINSENYCLPIFDFNSRSVHRSHRCNHVPNHRLGHVIKRKRSMSFRLTRGWALVYLTFQMKFDSSANGKGGIRKIIRRNFLYQCIGFHDWESPKAGCIFLGMCIV